MMASDINGKIVSNLYETRQTEKSATWQFSSKDVW